MAEQDVRFQVAQVEGVAVFLESATFPAGDTNRPGRGDRPVNLAIHVQDLSLDAIFNHGEPRLHPLQANDLQTASNLLGTDQVAASSSGAFLAGLFPSFGGEDRAFPERPSPTLTGANRINGATLFTIIKDAITIGFFFQTSLAAVEPSVSFCGLIGAFASELRNGRNLFIVHPNKARRAGAAITASRAPKLQTIFVPGIGHLKTLVEELKDHENTIKGKLEMDAKVLVSDFRSFRLS
jgi:hypothetical protein